MATSSTAAVGKTADTAHDSVEKASRKVHETIDGVEQRTREGIEAGREKLKTATAAVEQLEAQAEVTLEDATVTVTRYIQEKPLQAAGIAFAAGVFASLLLRRG